MKALLFALWVLSPNGHSVRVTEPIYSKEMCQEMIDGAFKNGSDFHVVLLACIPEYIFETKK